MSYKKPTPAGVANAIAEGWDAEKAEKGYTVFDCGNTGMLDIERIDDAYIHDQPEVSDLDCAVQAAIEGEHIIPVNQLPDELSDEFRYFGWLDTPVNRRVIRQFCGLLPFGSNQQVIDEAAELLKDGNGVHYPILEGIIVQYSAIEIYSQAVSHDSTGLKGKIRSILTEDKCVPEDVRDFLTALHRQLNSYGDDNCYITERRAA